MLYNLHKLCIQGTAQLIFVEVLSHSCFFQLTLMSTPITHLCALGLLGLSVHLPCPHLFHGPYHSAGCAPLLRSNVETGARAGCQAAMAMKDAQAVAGLSFLSATLCTGLVIYGMVVHGSTRERDHAHDFTKASSGITIRWT